MKHTDACSIKPEAQREKCIIALKMSEKRHSLMAITQSIGVHSRTVQKWLVGDVAKGVGAAIECKLRGYSSAVLISENHALV